MGPLNDHIQKAVLHFHMDYFRECNVGFFQEGQDPAIEEGHGSDSNSFSRLFGRRRYKHSDGHATRGEVKTQEKIAKRHNRMLKIVISRGAHAPACITMAFSSP